MIHHPAQVECLRPREIFERVRQSPVAWIPLGALEWHGWHAPIGLDGHTAHRICLKSSEVAGGVVFPPFFSGMTGSIASHPWTILERDEKVLEGWLETQLLRLEELGVKSTVIVSGHFALYQVESLRKVMKWWESKPRVMILKAVTVADFPNLKNFIVSGPDHGGLFETSLMKELCPEMIDLEELGSEKGDFRHETSNGIQRRDPSHPLFGVMGEDPRKMDDKKASELVKEMIKWLVGLV